MVTLIAVYNSDGCVGRCDERCYNARDSTCTCICRSMNHSRGLATALDNVRAHAERILERVGASKAVIDETVPQLSLF